MELCLKTSLCFSPDIAKRLNDLAFRMDRRIFLFAYYEPKPYREDESWHSRFCTAVVNLYGLLIDCGPFLGSVLKDLSKTWRASDVRNDYYQLRADISALRAIFCHNCSRELHLNAEHYSHAEEYILSHTGMNLSLEELEQAHWKTLLQALDASARRWADGLEKALNGLILSSDASKRGSTINFWIRQIALSYQKNPGYLMHTMSALYQLYLENGGSRPECHPDAPLRYQTTMWLRDLYDEDPGRDWYSRWLPKEESGLEGSGLYKLLWDWPAKWAKWNGCGEEECDEPPLPAGPFFRILAYDVDQYAGNPKGGYDPTVVFP